LRMANGQIVILGILNQVVVVAGFTAKGFCLYKIEGFRYYVYNTALQRATSYEILRYIFDLAAALFP